MKRFDAGDIDVCAMDNDVWSTALCALALHAAGERRDGEVLGRARSHLLATQSRTPMPRDNQRKPGAVRTGGWPFQRGNVTMPDTDDTGVVLAALATLAGDSAQRDLFRAIDDGVAWVRDMQNPDGGFPTFVWGLPSKAPGPMFLRDLPARLDDPRALLSAFLHPAPEYGDPSLEGVTGRVLWGLGRTGVGRDDPAVRRAIDFLRAQQCESGAWWGRWKACYLAETATVLLGLAAVGEDMEAHYVQRALRWILARQNADGGFGETPEAYRDPHVAGRGPSMPPVTAYVLLGCLATGRAPPDAMHAAARYLLESQDELGLWSNSGFLHTFVPPDLLYTYEVPAHALPILALAEYDRWLAR
jgi:squalene-hopene/tetraprenyl-beta-curcumene cyclase